MTIPINFLLNMIFLYWLLTSRQEQESANKLHVIRVSNQGDFVPTNPSPFTYTQNGVNMHVRDDGKEMELKYGNKKSLISQFNLAPLKKHGFPCYEDRLFQDDETKSPNLEILDDSFENSLLFTSL